MIVHFAAQVLKHWNICFFNNCEIVKELWHNIELWYHGIENIEIDKETVFLGSDNSLLHTVIMTAKQYIFKSNCAELVPVFRGFYNSLLQVKSFELYNAKYNNNISLLDKWTPVEQAVE